METPGNASSDSASSNRNSFFIRLGIETWRFNHFGSTAETPTSAFNADPNNDGESNLLEFATGQDPGANTRLVTTLDHAGPVIEFTYQRSLAAMAGGMTYAVQWSSGLGTWDTDGVTEQILSTSGDIQTIKASLPRGSDSRFVRLKVTQP